jgi:DTW domain-containing protein YfiP
MKCLRPEKKPEEKVSEPEDRDARAYCHSCMRPQRVCLCDFIKPQKNRIEVGIFQHPNEFRKTFNTARLAHLALENSFLEVNTQISPRGKISGALEKYSSNEMGILFPSPKAQDISEAKDLKCLLVLDGTWNEARKLYQRNDVLRRVPHYLFTPPEISSYTIRQEPQENYVCTLEAIAYALEVLEPDFNTEHLHQILKKLVSVQKSFYGKNRHLDNGRNRSARRRIGRLRWQLFSQNVEHVDVKPLLQELKELEQQIRNNF